MKFQPDDEQILDQLMLEIAEGSRCSGNKHCENCQVIAIFRKTQLLSHENEVVLTTFCLTNGLMPLLAQMFTLGYKFSQFQQETVELEKLMMEE